MILSIFLLIVPILIGSFFLVRFLQRSKYKAREDNSLKQFFQYFLLFGLLIVVAVGLTGLIGRMLSQATFVVVDQAALARNISFVVVGLPILIGLVIWLKNQHQVNESERKSFAWGFYLTVISVFSLLVSLTAANQILRWIVQLDDYSSQAVAQLIVWSAIWVGHWRLVRNFADQKQMQINYLVGSFIGLFLGIVGLTGLISSAINSLLIDLNTNVLRNNLEGLLSSIISLGLAAAVWTIYWVKISAKTEKSNAWYVYLLLIVIGGSLITFVSTLSAGFYQILVWFLGEPIENTAILHFQNTPSLLAISLTMFLVWWYHRKVLLISQVTGRTEIDRIYDYLISAIGLVAATIGLITVLVAFIESLTAGLVISGANAINTLLVALTLLLVGVPVWFMHWSRAQKLVNSKDLEEIGSSTRRIYLFLLFGVSGIAAVISLILAVFFLLEDILTAGLTSETFRQMRYPLAILVSTAGIASYHWSIFKNERYEITKSSSGPKFIYIISPADPDLANWLSENTKAKFRIWYEKEGSTEVFSRSSLLDLISSVELDTIFIVNEKGSPRLIEVHDQ
jgi:hypothetical protein